MRTCQPEDEPPINVPYGCLLPETVGNLLVAGRCISVDLAMHNSLRLIPPWVATGQAAGVAASLAAKEKVRLRETDRSQLRSLLVEDNMYLVQQDASVAVAAVQASSVARSRGAELDSTAR